MGARRRKRYAALRAGQLELLFGKTALQGPNRVKGEAEEICPSCGSRLVKRGWWKCFSCGFESCGLD